MPLRRKPLVTRSEYASLWIRWLGVATCERACLPGR
jgi:hypothetical protein